MRLLIGGAEENQVILDPGRYFSEIAPASVCATQPRPAANTVLTGHSIDELRGQVDLDQAGATWDS